MDSQEQPPSTPFQKFSLIPEEPRSIATDGTELKEDIDVSKKPDFVAMAIESSGKGCSVGDHKRGCECHRYQSACERIWDEYVSPLQSRISELAQQIEQFKDRIEVDALIQQSLQARIQSLEAENEELRNSVDGWISVKERLPEEYVSVLAYDPVERIKYGVDYWNGKIWGDFNNEPPTVTHWQPLPSPPHNQEQNEK